MGSLEMTYRNYLPDISTPRFTAMAKQNAHEYGHDFKAKGNPPWLYGLYMHWLELLREPFKGVTNDGVVRPNLFEVLDEGVPIERIVKAAQDLTLKLDEQQRGTLFYHIDDPQWRTWSNPEFLISHKGMRLDEVSRDVRSAAMKILEETLSPEGYTKAVSAMRINGFLGELVEGTSVMNEWSYNICFFGQPSTTRPWGLSFYGHHLCLNVFFYKTQIIVSPWFTGAEPNMIDRGPFAGTRILHEEEKFGLQLMQSLSPEMQAKAQIFKLMKDPNMPHGRWNHDDQRHLCGAYRDNRIVPYEGIKVSDFNSAQQRLVLEILNQYLLYLPQRSRQMKIEHIVRHFEETFFSWIGGFERDDPFYFRFQSPVILIEFDHHSGVFLTNEEPAKFHIHTILRTPNGGDYGYAVRCKCGVSDPSKGGVKQDFVWEG